MPVPGFPRQLPVRKGKTKQKHCGRKQCQKLLKIHTYPAKDFIVVCDDARADGEVLQIANLLCKGNIAVSGHIASCERLPEVAEAAGAMKSIPLAVAGAFHTPIMESAVAKLESALSEIEIGPTRIPVYSNVDAQPHSQPEEFKQLLVSQVCCPVLWQESIEKMIADGYDEFYEVGVGWVLRSLMKRIARKTKIHGVLE